jgi:hypothetical protein
MLELEDHYSGIREISEERSLANIHSEVARRSGELGQGGPWGIGLNGDFTLARCLYIICRALKPTTVVETGVAYGVSSAFILEALSRNGAGTLQSIDLPPLAPDAGRYVGILVPERLRRHWHLHIGTSSRLLPTLVARGVDLFVHDSLHTYRNMGREFRTVWPHLPPGGIVVSDDIEGNPAFEELVRHGARFWEAIGMAAKPTSLFGIAIKA